MLLNHIITRLTSPVSTPKHAHTPPQVDFLGPSPDCGRESRGDTTSTSSSKTSGSQNASQVREILFNGSPKTARIFLTNRSVQMFTETEQCHEKAFQQNFFLDSICSIFTNVEQTGIHHQESTTEASGDLVSDRSGKYCQKQTNNV